ncbi:MAG: tol-pal system protein YbgF [Proteobacteria bacterium]|nr:tol-pal system protein YbgF [Pseudomonadota bacterium]
MAGIIALCVVVGVPAAAQDSDARALQDRLQRLDRELSGLQQQVYRGRSTTPSAPPAPAPAAPATLAAAATLQTRIAQIEGELRSTNGQLEEINFAVGDLRQRLDRLVTDLDFRLSALEKTFAQRPPPAAAATPAAAAGAAKPGAAAQPPAKPAAVPAVKLPKGTTREQYDFAFDLLKRTEYVQAEQALKQFVAAHPKDPLASNAQYWLGETFFARNNFGDAAAQYLIGYQKYPQSPRAPEYLYKLGLSLAKLGKTPEACAAFARFQKEYPNAAGAFRGRVADERQKLKCS